MDINAVKERLDKELGVIIRYDKNGNPHVSMPVGKVPMQQFKEFDHFVNSEHAGNRWLAIWTLFLRNKQFDIQVEAEAYRQELLNPQEDSNEDNNPLGLLNG